MCSFFSPLEKGLWCFYQLLKVVFNVSPLHSLLNPKIEEPCLKIRIRTLAPVIKSVLMSYRPLGLTSENKASKGTSWKVLVIGGLP